MPEPSALEVNTKCIICDNTFVRPIYCTGLICPDCITKIKIGDTWYSGFPLKPCKPTGLNARKDIIKLPDNVFSTVSSEASQALKNTFKPIETKYHFPNTSNFQMSDCKSWRELGHGLL